MSIPLIFKTLEVRNFLSYGNQTQVFDLFEQKTVSIEGQNLDNGGSNGSGKSSIINALCYAIFNKPFDSISLQRLINSTNATKNTLMEVRLIFEKGGIEYEIYRARGEEYKIEIKRDGEDITPGKGVTECDELIESIIGISYDLFTKTVIFSGNSPAFLQLPIAQQRNQIEELFNITMLSEKAQMLKEKIRQTESDIKIAEAVCAQQQVAVDLHKKHLKEAEDRVSRWETSRAENITNIEATLEALATIDFVSEKSLHDEKDKLKEESAYLSARLVPLKKDKQFLSKEVEKLIGEESHLVDQRCPYCSQTYASAPERLSALRQLLEEKGAKLLETEEKETTLDVELKQKKDRLATLESEIKHPDLADLLTARENAASLRNKIEELKLAENPHVEARDTLLNEAVDTIDFSKVDVLRKRLDHQNFLVKLLTDKNSFLRRKIINQTIPFLNSRVNLYTRTLGLPHLVKFDADMSCTVSEFGRELDFGNLSAGEKKRVNTALMLAFRDVLHHLHARTNVLLIDELDGALDQNGIDSIVRLLKEKARDEEMSIFVISHHPAIAGRLDNSLLVRKINGFSEVVVQ